MFLVLVLLFILLPLAEIAVLIKAGGAIGLIPTLLTIVFTGILGATLARREGLKVFYEIQRQTAQGLMPGKEMIEAFLIAMAGVVLVTPGFITDAIGFAVLIPFIRRYLIDAGIELLRRKFENQRTHIHYRGGGFE